MADGRERPEEVREQARLFRSLRLRTATGAFLSRALDQTKGARRTPAGSVPNQVNRARLRLAGLGR
jgi:hypothetical protein